MKLLFKYTMKLFKLIGYWPLKTQNRTALFAYKVYFGITLTIYFILAVTMALEIPNAAKYGLKKLVNNISMTAQYIYGLIKIACFSLPIFKSLFQRISVTENNIFKSENVGVKAVYMKYVKVNNKIAEGWLVLIVVVDTVFITYPWLMGLTNSNADLTLPLDLYFPFDYRDYYWTTYFFISLSGLVITAYLTATNMIYLSVMVFIISQLAILKYEIAEGIDTTKFSDEEIHQNLRKITMYYQSIAKFVEDFNQVTKFLNLLYFIICVAHTSMIGFEIVTDDLSFLLLKNIFYLIGSLIIDFFTWYAYGNAITLQHATVLEAIWESDWYNCSVKNKKTILMIMLQFKKPLKLTVGFSFDLSLETMVMVLRMSMSYMITLKQFYALKELNNN